MFLRVCLEFTVELHRYHTRKTPHNINVTLLLFRFNWQHCQDHYLFIQSYKKTCNHGQSRPAPTHPFSALCQSPPSYPSIILAYVTDQNGKPIDPSKPRPQYLRTASGRLFERDPSCKPSSLKRPASPNSSSQRSHSPPSDPNIIFAYISDQAGKPIDPSKPHPEYLRTASGKLFERSPSCTPHFSTLKHKPMDVGAMKIHAGAEKQVEVVKSSAYTVSVDEKGRRSCVWSLERWRQMFGRRLLRRRCWWCVGVVR
ncbi:hypothetical protein IQ07DRAFT_50730 [Pyrenochaeta sp. DS3sAY3a]|nr:hypothetical protein IQ07DRAFT_50730 [Pyrenochaeta sp. DS3sAY3a]